jgi:hypothetical protein
MLSLKPRIFAAIFIGIFAQCVFAAETGLVSAYSDVGRAKCVSSGRATSDDAPVTRRCKMLDDLTLIAVYEGSAVRISVLRNGEDTGLRLGAGYDVGEELEWRGRRGNQNFEPAAAILRLIERTGDKSYASALLYCALRMEKFVLRPGLTSKRRLMPTPLRVR